MFCKNCGYAVSEQAEYCLNCGTRLKAPDKTAEQPASPYTVPPAAENPYVQQQNPYTAPPVVEQPYAQQQNPYTAPPVYAKPYPTKEYQSMESTALLFGILGLVFSLFLTITGIVLSAIGVSKGRAFRAQYGETSDKANAGYIMSVIGLVLSILKALAVLFIIVIMVLFAVSY